MSGEHFTAWVTTAADCLTDDFSDVSVLKDQKLDLQLAGGEVIEWASDGGPLFCASTGIRRDAGPQDQADAARQVLGRAGWQIVGSWQMVPTGMIVTVARV